MTHHVNVRASRVAEFGEGFGAEPEGDHLGDERQEQGEQAESELFQSRCVSTLVIGGRSASKQSSEPVDDRIKSRTTHRIRVVPPSVIETSSLGADTTESFS